MRFVALPASEVLVGRGRIAHLAREPYYEALRTSEAGRVELERGETLMTVKRLLQAASKELGIRIRSSAENDGRALVWKRVPGQRSRAT